MNVPDLSDKSDRIRIETQTLSQNFRLTDPEQRVVRELLTEALGELSAGDAEILRVRERLHELELNRQKILARIQGFRTGLTARAHSMLPTELLRKIFEYCCSSWVELPGGSTQEIWLLSQVCSKWREVLDDPTFWSEVRVTKDLVGTDGITKKAEEAIHDIFSNRGRQGIIQYNTSISDLMEWGQVIRLLDTYPSRLRKLVLHSNVSYSDDDRSPDFSPLFSQVKTSYWACLIHLTIHEIRMTDFSRFIRQCSGLISCEVKFRLYDKLQKIPDPITLERLQSIQIQPNLKTDVRRLLKCLILPALKSFEILDSCDMPTWKLELFKMVKRSHYNMQVLDLGSTSILATAVIPLMTLMPHLTTFVAWTLGIVSQSDLDTILSDDLCPNLVRLVGWEVSSIHAFIAFLERRWEKNDNAMRDVSMGIRPKSLPLSDKEYYYSLVPELEKKGRSLKAYFYHSGTLHGFICPGWDHDAIIDNDPR